MFKLFLDLCLHLFEETCFYSFVLEVKNSEFPQQLEPFSLVEPASQLIIRPKLVELMKELKFAHFLYFLISFP
jgi:hypothetical protein